MSALRCMCARADIDMGRFTEGCPLHTRRPVRGVYNRHDVMQDALRRIAARSSSEQGSSHVMRDIAAEALDRLGVIA